VRTASFVETISEAESTRYLEGLSLLLSLVSVWHVASTKALGPLSNTIKYILCEFDPYKNPQAEIGKYSTNNSREETNTEGLSL
jgi:hypothetical protein